MALPGPRPKPTQIRLLEEDLSKRPVVLDDFRPIVEIPECPPHLKGEAEREWHRLSGELVRYGMISKVDRGVLAMICTIWARYVEAEEMIERTAKAAGGSGLFVKSPNGYPIQSPWLAVSNKSMELYRSFLSEFGLSPSARTRVLPGEFQLELPGLGDESDSNLPTDGSGAGAE
jgi:P27 family predicted phage terminase small subunit